MLRSLPQSVKDVSVLRRILFAVATLPDGFPNRWEVATKFAFNRSQTKGSCLPPAENTQVFVDNLQELDAAAFSTDRELLLELMSVRDSKDRPLGIILMSNKENCVTCGSKLQLRKDRPANVIVYDDVMGTVPGTHYHKTCSNRSCGTTQFYGYTIAGKSSDVHFDTDWELLSYFVSSRDSVFSMRQLRMFDSEIIVGQMSFKQCAEAYNYYHASSDLATERDMHTSFK